MENIQIKKHKNKRSIESLIDQSAIDNSFNYEAHELRKAFNQTLMNMNNKNQEREKEIEKLKILIKEYQQIKTNYENKISKLQQQLTLKTHQLQQITKHYKQNKQKLQYLQYKIQNITENRNALNEDEPAEDDHTQLDKQKIKNQICDELAKIITKKVQYFTREIKQHSMSPEVESKIQSFLEELLYLNPHSEFTLQQKTEHRAIGKIKKEDKQTASNNEWLLLEKSLQKLKKINQQRNPLLDKPSTEPSQNRSISLHKRKKLFQN